MTRKSVRNIHRTDERTGGRTDRTEIVSVCVCVCDIVVNIAIHYQLYIVIKNDWFAVIHTIHNYLAI